MRATVIVVALVVIFGSASIADIYCMMARTVASLFI